MEKFFNTIPGIVISLGAILTVVVSGLLYVLGLWKKGKNGEDDRLINILQETVNELEKKVNGQKDTHDLEVKNLNDKIDGLVEKVDTLEKENQTLTRVLQGRDEETQKFYNKAFEAIDTGKQTHLLVEQMSKSQGEFIQVLKEFLQKK